MCKYALLAYHFITKQSRSFPFAKNLLRKNKVENTHFSVDEVRVRYRDLKNSIFSVKANFRYFISGYLIETEQCVCVCALMYGRLADVPVACIK